MLQSLAITVVSTCDARIDKHCILPIGRLGLSRLTSARHYEVIELILVVGAFHGIKGRRRCLILRRTLLRALLYDIRHQVLPILLILHLLLRPSLLNFELFRVLSWQPIITHAPLALRRASLLLL